MDSEPRSLGDLLRSSCTRWRDNTASLVPGAQGFESVSYGELWLATRRYADALRGLGLNRGDRVAIQSDNCPEWAGVDWACQCLGVVPVPIYPTLPPDQARYIVQDCGAKIVIAGAPEQAQKTSGLPGVRSVLLKGAPDSIGEIASSGSLMPEAELSAAIDSVSPEDLATIIYTSGTTGLPKGAMLPHRAPCWLLKRIVLSLPIDESDTFLTFLPMSHVFERVAGQWLPVSCGATIGFAKSLMTLASDLQAVKPTLLLSVPRFLEATRDKIVEAAQKGRPIQRFLFGLALAQGAKRAKGGFAPLAGALDGIVGKKIRSRVGGRIRFFVSGGAALPPHVAEFYMAFGLNILQGYGLTETTAASSVNHPENSKYWTVGEPIPGVEMKLAADGEILIRGPSVMSGYFNLPEETAKALDADGWFRTGDIGEWEGKHLKITDRKKDLLVLANGKNIAPQPIENKLRESELIAEVVLFGDGSEYVYGLIVPNFEALGKRMAADGKQVGTNAELVASDAARALVKADIDAVNKTLADFEKVKKWALVDAAFSVESGELTPTLKVKRKVVREKFAEVLKGLA